MVFLQDSQNVERKVPLLFSMTKALLELSELARIKGKIERRFETTRDQPKRDDRKIMCDKHCNNIQTKGKKNNAKLKRGGARLLRKKAALRPRRSLVET